MAIFTAGPAVSEIRGSAGGTTFSRNRFGAYTRQRTKPVNPNSPAQVQARSRLSALTVYWRDTLTQAQRDAWDAYAAATTWKNALGMDIKLTGLNHFLRAGQLRLQAGEAVIAAAPATPGIPAEEDLWTAAATVAGNTIDVTYTFGTSVDDQVYNFFASRPYAASKNFFAGPWRYIGSVVGDSGTPPTSPASFAYPWTLVAGQRVWVYCRRADADNRVNEPFQATVLAA
jgi:hypothetical protein